MSERISCCLCCCALVALVTSTDLNFAAPSISFLGSIIHLVGSTFGEPWALASASMTINSKPVADGSLHPVCVPHHHHARAPGSPCQASKARPKRTAPRTRSSALRLGICRRECGMSIFVSETSPGCFKESVHVIPALGANMVGSGHGRRSRIV